MTKNILAVLAAGCGLFMTSCETPKDYRPESKVSVDYVQPGTRSTYNVSDMGADMPGDVHDAGHAKPETTEKREEVMPNADLGGNTIQPGDSIKETTETNSEAGAIKR
ncbi:hypothetical protein [Pontibacter roseus]|uniref:hypothetical protein n=1 Tax=Pontibacter roseus TaxID=336989 RepID=UPI000369C007|nr:hypothetical protein [Pontibacter roseus]